MKLLLNFFFFLLIILQFRVLDLSENQFTGGIDESVSSFESLQLLDVTNTGLNGSLAHVFGAPSLRYDLRIVIHQPFRIVQPPCLTSHLWLASCFGRSLQAGLNQFTDSLPSTLSSSASLQELNVTTNSLSGSLPLALCDLPALRYLACHTPLVIARPEDGVVWSVHRSSRACCPACSASDRSTCRSTT
jgi:hypothetical protein